MNFLRNKAPDSVPSSRSNSPSLDSKGLTQTISHTIQGDTFSFEVPVSSDDNGLFVMLQPVLDIFPETVALCREDKSQHLPFLTNLDGVLLVPMRVSYCPDETLHIVPASQRTNNPSRDETWQSTSQSESQYIHTHTLPNTNPFRRDIELLETRENSSSQNVNEELDFTELAILASSLGFDDIESLFGSGISAARTQDDNIFDPHLNFDRNPLVQPSIEEVQPEITEPEHQTEDQSYISTLGAALISKTIPISEQLLSRLFIILPDPKPRQRPENEATNSQQSTRAFRLYFLCDCGPGATFPLLKGTRTTGQNTSTDKIDINNCIHIANQPGYEVLDLKQFSEQFGLYTLLILQIFQQGIKNVTTRRGCIEKSKISIPPLSQAHYTDVLQPFTWDIMERVSTAIEKLKEITDCRQLEQIEEIPEIDIRRLWECVDGLQVGEGESHAEGMRRMFVHDGTYRWICTDHYQSTFEYLQEDRDNLIHMCRLILGDDNGNDISDQFEAGNGNDAAFLSSGRTLSFDDHKKHLRLSSNFTVQTIKDIQSVLNDDYMVQQVTLVSPFSSIELLVAITEMITKSKNIQWNLLFTPGKYISASASTVDIASSATSTTSSAPPPYSKTNRPGTNHQEPSTSSSVRTTATTPKERYTNGSLHPICDLFLLAQIQSLSIPDLDRELFDNLDPSPGEFPHLNKLHIWGSDTRNDRNSESNEPSSWNYSGLGALLKAFCNLTELHITGINLGKKSSKDSEKVKQNHRPSTRASDPPQLSEIVQCLLYLPKLSVLDLSCCGLVKENCLTLASSLALLNNKITHLDIHDNWIEDEGLAEILWVIGKRLYSLDARNTGFGNASAFALASMVQSHQDEIRQNQENGLGGRMTIYRVLRLEENCDPFDQLYPSDGESTLSLSSLSKAAAATAPNLDENGRQNLIRALELLEPKELCLRFDLGFKDLDFASAFSGMKNLECLERLQVSNSNFGPEALAAMLRILRATSCRIRDLEIHSTLLSDKEQQEALEQILTI
ncbi:hypothetical protein BGZ46_000449 [Entomortierella lignicola]|nr:hypothetical protein BGZ46_000449 [Entomortierella lignicola]